MNGRWGLQAKMTATYVAVTAGAVLLTELVIFGAAALSPPTPLTPQAVQGLAEGTAQGQAAKLANVIGKAHDVRAADLATTDVPVSPGQARPDGNGGVAIPRLTGPDCDLAPASFAVVVSHTGTVLASSYQACYPVGSKGSSAQGGVPRKVLTFVRWPSAHSGRAPLPSGDVVWAAAPIVLGPASTTTPVLISPAETVNPPIPGAAAGTCT